MKDFGGRIDKHRSHHNEQQNGEHQHQVLGSGTQVLAYQLGQTGTVMTHGEHARQVVVGGSGKDTAEDNP